MRNTAGTRERLLVTATNIFAERGFYGTSIAAVANELSLSKQALLHHFESKEKLYGAVLQLISDRLIKELDYVLERYDAPRDAIEAALLALYRASDQNRDDTQILMRELLDNKRRADVSRTWYLKPFLDRLAELAMHASSRGIMSTSEALIVVYQFLGSINYFLVSEPTLARMYGKNEFEKLKRNYERELKMLISDRLDNEP